MEQLTGEIEQLRGDMEQLREQLTGGTEQLAGDMVVNGRHGARARRREGARPLGGINQQSSGEMEQFQAK